MLTRGVVHRDLCRAVRGDGEGGRAGDDEVVAAVGTKVTEKAPVPLLLAVMFSVEGLPTVASPKVSAIGATAMCAPDSG